MCNATNTYVRGREPPRSRGQEGTLGAACERVADRPFEANVLGFPGAAAVSCHGNSL